MLQEATINVNGIVQGVGFRPFVYKLAKTYSLNGFVLNLGDAGVKIVLEGERSLIEKFITTLKSNPPSISRIDTLEIIWQDACNHYADFSIEKSSDTKSEESEPVIPPDISICDQCVNDLFSESSRWIGYPFTSCAACGPRFSTITDLPYDRPNTTMDDFPLCDTCNTGYTDPIDRRYHAQTTACERCGPKYYLRNKRGNVIPSTNPILSAAKILQEGKVLAMQGISGTHLITITSKINPIKKLRKRKSRFQRPFAIMVRDIQSIQQNFQVSEKELELLTSWRRPIVLVKRGEKTSISNVLPVIHDRVLEEISPGLDTVGVMLPYAPVHHLLFDNLPEEIALVMTSANPTGIPMYINPTIITNSLRNIGDYFLLHNRRIYQRADDSVIKFVTKENHLFIRRARGYTPEPIHIQGVDKSLSVLGVGPEEKVMATLLKAGILYPTQYIGDTNNVENIEFLKNAYHHLSHLIGAKEFDAIACDLHPEFLSTAHAEQISKENKIPLFRVQHHHAHLSSVLADHNLPYDTSIICITSDGYGYGQDGTGWGGEILIGSSIDFKNMAGLQAYDYPGGDLSAIFGVRPLIGILKERLDEDKIFSIVKGMPISGNSRVTEKTLDTLLKAIDNDVNCITTSSTGRYLDAVAALLGVCDTNSYDGECPMKLEAVSRKNEDIHLEAKYVMHKGRQVIDLAEYLESMIEFKKRGISIPNLAHIAQWSLGEALANMGSNIAEQEGIKYVGFSGGVALNRIITKVITSTVESHGLTPLIHKRVPPGDGGVSIGQVMVAASHLLNK